MLRFVLVASHSRRERFPSFCKRYRLSLIQSAVPYNVPYAASQFAFIRAFRYSGEVFPFGLAVVRFSK